MSCTVLNWGGMRLLMLGVAPYVSHENCSGLTIGSTSRVASSASVILSLAGRLGQGPGTLEPACGLDHFCRPGRLRRESRLIRERESCCSIFQTRYRLPCGVDVITGWKSCKGPNAYWTSERSPTNDSPIPSTCLSS